MKSNIQWTLVTGGAKKLGAEICASLATHGYSVLIHYNTSRQEALSLVEKCQSLGVWSDSIQGNFSSFDSVQDFLHRAASQFPNIKYLINNVGNYRIESALSTEAPDWYNLFQTNFHAPVTLIREFLPQIIKNKGSIINIGVAGVQCVPANTHSTAYTASKLSLWMVTKSLAKELAPYGVRLNMVSPGVLDNAVDVPTDQTVLPMKRAGTPAEVAQAVLFLLDEKNSYITGQNIEVAGGVRL